MPIYEYICTTELCDTKVELMQKMSDEPLVFCPNCGEKSMKKIISSSNFILKGGGWYKSSPQPKNE